MSKAKLISAVVVLLVQLPIWFYLLHFMLKQTGAGELQWFLFWVYIPAGILVHFLTATATTD